MALDTFIQAAKKQATSYLLDIEKFFEKDKTDVLAYFGSIDDNYEQIFKTALDGLVSDLKVNNHETLCIVLQTFGGSITTTEKFVNMVRKYYKQVFFIVPNYAMSAGTIWCMSGNKIFMDYSSSLGPIDPQIYSQTIKQFVPANGYIAEYEELVHKGNALTEAEFILLDKKLDYAFLNQCRKLNELTVKLLKEWLVTYKFKDWKVTQTSNKTVTTEMKQQRAEDIAKELGNNSKWCIHGRPLMIPTLETIGLQIDDYSDNTDLQKIIRNYIDYMNSYIRSATNATDPQFVHTRMFM